MEIVEAALLLTINFALVSTLSFEKPAAKTVWQEHCLSNSRVLNDCNWCRCNRESRYTCDARSCREVDMFGHFKDAIQEYQVGMEGNGPWRSTRTACEPGVHYRRANILCVCGEDGAWPNPVCRDIFRVLHSVIVINETKPMRSQKCIPNNLYLIGCNVCYCKSDGHIDPDVCIQISCEDNDPITKTTEQKADDSTHPEEITISEVYAECNPNLKYKLGCQTCNCLRNNRLLCSNCTKSNTRIRDKTIPRTRRSLCSKFKAGEIFNVGCNSCFCNEKELVYCTTKRCIDKNKESIDEIIKKNTESKLETVETPIEDSDCTPGTKYKKDCNICYCLTRDKKKTFACTKNKCNSIENALVSIQNDCINNTYYELNCLRCHCQISNGIKWQWCKVASKCTNKPGYIMPRSNNLSYLHGYCEPYHVYKESCNTCRCLSDGKTVICTARLCTERPINIDIIPVNQNGTSCPRGYSFKVDCNYCFCISDGDTICTTLNCDEEL